MKRYSLTLLAFVVSLLITSCTYEDTAILVYFTPGEVKVSSGALSETIILLVDPSHGLDSRTVTFSIRDEDIARIDEQKPRNVIIKGINPGQTVLRAAVSGITNQAIMTITVLPPL